VGLLAQGYDAASNSSIWIDGVYAGDPDLTSANRVAGWTIHPYGPYWGASDRILRLVKQTAAHGAPSTIPIDITEYGISTKNGVTLTDNFGWPLNLTYAQAGTALHQTVDSFLSNPVYGKRIRLFELYVVNDRGSAPANSNDRESFFGALDKNFNDKGAYTAEVRALMKR
jgi:hypothetical protein